MNVGQNSYFLQMRDDSMHNPFGAPCIPRGAFILVDPDVIPRSNDVVVVSLPEQIDLLIKVLVIDGPHRYLKSLNPQYRTIDVSEGAKFLGVVRQITQDL